MQRSHDSDETIRPDDQTNDGPIDDQSQTLPPTGGIGSLGRRTFLQGTLASTVAASVFSSVASPAVAQSTGNQDWPQFQFNSANTGYNPDALGPVRDIEERWHFQTGNVVFSSPAVANGTVYVASSDQNIYALDASDGTERWHSQIQTGVSTFSSPTVTNGTVYVGSLDSNVYALDASDGTERWHSQTGGAIYGALTVVNGTVYVANTDDYVYALDASDGTKRWHFRTQTGSVFSDPAVANGTVYVGSADTNVYALDASNGTERWHSQTQTGGYTSSSPAVADGTVYIGSDGNVYALDASDGTERWHSQIQTGHHSDSSPAVANGTVYIGSEDTNVYALDASDGTERWHTQTGGSVSSSPAVANGTIYVGSDDYNVYALDVSDGTERWRFQTGNVVFSSPAVVNGTVYIGSEDTNVYAIEGETSSGGGGSTNKSPVAEFTSSPQNPEAKHKTTFDASSSSDPDGSISKYQWNFDGQSGYEKTGTKATYTFGQPGQPTVKLRVTDGDGATNTATKQISVNVAGTSARLDVASTIEKKSVADLHHVQPATKKMNTINQKVWDGDIPASVATEAVERLIIGESFTKSTLNALGPDTYSRKGFHNDYLDNREVDFALRNADIVVNILVDLALMGRSVGQAVNSLVKYSNTKWATALPEGVSAIIDESVSKVIGFVASTSENAENMAKNGISDIADNVVGKISEGTLSGASAIEAYVNEQTRELKTTIAEELRRSVERPLEEYGGLIDPDPTIESHSNGIDRGVENLNIVLGPDTLQREGVSGSTDGAARAVSDGLTNMNAALTAAYRGMNSVQKSLDNLGNFKNVEKLIKAAENSNSKQAVISLIWTAATIVSKFGGVILRLFEIELGQTTLFHIGNIHYRTLDGVAHGGAER